MTRKKKAPPAKAAGPVGAPGTAGIADIKKADPPVAPDLKAQPNGGALLTGGVPGNAGGGRVPSLTREACRLAFDQRIKLLEDIADAQLEHPVQDFITGEIRRVVIIPDVPDRIRALDTLAKYGLGQAKDVTVDSVRDRLGKTLDTIQGLTSPDVYQLIVRAIQPIWA